MAAPSRWTDINLAVAASLSDMAAVQPDPYRRRGYAHAAAAVRDLAQPLDMLVGSGSPPRIPRIGPSSWKVIAEMLAGGHSPTVERAVAESGRRAEVERRRGLRDGYLSRAGVNAVLDVAGRYGEHRADLQMHSTWSDGRASIAAMIDGCLARGYTHAALTDHAETLSVAGGRSMADFRRQGAEIDALNAGYGARFRMLKAVEANIDAAGGLDIGADDRRHFDLVVAAIHSGLRSTGDQTARLLAAVRAPGVHVLGHPRGRQFSTRAGVRADWPAVFAAAAAHRVAVELDGDPARQDLDAGLAVQARAAGCVFALDSDAHAPEELDYVEVAMAHARLAGIPAERIVNCWPLERLLDWIASRPH
ncbi:MAG: PHP domain-containing protein [Vicinamibacterales bacterium]